MSRTEFLGIRIDVELKKKLKERCRENVSECVRKAIIQYLKGD